VVGFDKAPLDLLAIAGGISVLVGAIGRCFYLIGQLQARVDILLGFLFRRGEAEATQKGWGRFNSPFALTVDGLSAIMPFLDKFIPLYAELAARNATEPEMFLEFESRFGDFIVQKICIPNGVSTGACLVSIIKACRASANG
jgi:hypothetical protein